MNYRLLQKITGYIATLGPIGYLPAPGTCGTLAAIPMMYAVRTYVTHGWGLDERLSIALICFGAIWCINKALPAFSDFDPSEIVLDEVVGFAVAMYMIPFTLPFVGVITVLFRVYDIGKLFHVGVAEQVPGALGVVIDDVIAGILANITLQILLRLI